MDDGKQPAEIHESLKTSEQESRKHMRNTSAAFFERIVVKQQLITSLHTHIHMNHVLMAEARHNVFKEPYSVTEDVVDVKLMDRNEYSTVITRRKSRKRQSQRREGASHISSSRRSRRDSASPDGRSSEEDGLQVLDKFMAEPVELVPIYNRFRRKHATMAAGHINDYAALMQAGLEIIAQTLSTLESAKKSEKEKKKDSRSTKSSPASRSSRNTLDARTSTVLKPKHGETDVHQPRRRKITSRSEVKIPRRIQSAPHFAISSPYVDSIEVQAPAAEYVQKSKTVVPNTKRASVKSGPSETKAKSTPGKCLSSQCCDSTELKHHMKVRFRSEHSRFADRFDVSSEIFTGLMCRYEALLQQQIQDYASFQVELISTILDRLRTTLQHIVRAEEETTAATATAVHEQQTSTNVPTDTGSMTKADIAAMVERVVDRNTRKQKIFMMDFFSQLGLVKVGAGLKEPSCCRVAHKVIEELPSRRHSTVPMASKQSSSIRTLFSLAVDEDMRKLITEEVDRFLGPMQNVLHAHLEFVIRNQQRFANLLLARLPPHSAAMPDAALTMTCCYQKRLESLNMGTPYLTGCYLNGVSKHYENLRVLATEFYHNRLAELKARADKSRRHSSHPSSATQPPSLLPPSRTETWPNPPTTATEASHATPKDPLSLSKPPEPVTLSSVFSSARKVVVKSMDLIDSHPRQRLVITPRLGDIIGRVTAGCHQAARLRALCTSLQEKTPHGFEIDIRRRARRSTLSGGTSRYHQTHHDGQPIAEDYFTFCSDSCSSESSS